MDDMGDKRKRYTKEFKLEAVRMLEAGGKPGHQIEKDLGIGSGQVYKWSESAGIMTPGSAVLATPLSAGLASCRFSLCSSTPFRVSVRTGGN